MAVPVRATRTRAAVVVFHDPVPVEQVTVGGGRRHRGSSGCPHPAACSMNRSGPSSGPLGSGGGGAATVTAWVLTRAKCEMLLSSALSMDIEHLSSTAEVLDPYCNVMLAGAVALNRGAVNVRPGTVVQAVGAVRVAVDVPLGAVVTTALDVDDHAFFDRLRGPTTGQCSRAQTERGGSGDKPAFHSHSRSLSGWNRASGSGWTSRRSPCPQ